MTGGAVRFCIPLSYFVSPEVGLVLLVFKLHVHAVFFVINKYDVCCACMMYCSSILLNSISLTSG